MIINKMFTPEEIKAAEEVKNEIINGNVEELKSIYMAGEINMWNELQIKYNNTKSNIRFELPSVKQMIDIAILFNDGKLEQEKLADMLAYGQFIVNRLYENGDITKPSQYEENGNIFEKQK